MRTLGFNLGFLVCFLVCVSCAHAPDIENVDGRTWKSRASLPRQLADLKDMVGVWEGQTVHLQSGALKVPEMTITAVIEPALDGQALLMNEKGIADQRPVSCTISMLFLDSADHEPRIFTYSPMAAREAQSADEGGLQIGAGEFSWVEEHVAAASQPEHVLRARTFYRHSLKLISSREIHELVETSEDGKAWAKFGEARLERAN